MHRQLYFCPILQYVINSPFLNFAFKWFLKDLGLSIFHTDFHFAFSLWSNFRYTWPDRYTLLHYNNRYQYLSYFVLYLFLFMPPRFLSVHCVITRRNDLILFKPKWILCKIKCISAYDVYCVDRANGVDEKQSKTKAAVPELNTLDNIKKTTRPFAIFVNQI